MPAQQKAGFVVCYFMRPFMIILFISFLSCNNFSASDKLKKKDADSILSINEIQYKQNIYKLFLGQTKDSVENIIEIQRNFEAERNFNVDSIQHYMNIGENLIKVVDTDTINVLPALYFTFRKKLLTDFEFYVLYQPQEKSKKSIYNFLTSLQPYFNKLADTNIKNELSEKLSVRFDNLKSEEKFYIDTSREYELLFGYNAKAK